MEDLFEITFKGNIVRIVKCLLKRIFWKENNRIVNYNPILKIVFGPQFPQFMFRNYYKSCLVERMWRRRGDAAAGRRKTTYFIFPPSDWHTLCAGIMGCWAERTMEDGIVTIRYWAYSALDNTHLLSGTEPPAWWVLWWPPSSPCLHTPDQQQGQWTVSLSSAESHSHLQQGARVCRWWGLYSLTWWSCSHLAGYTLWLYDILHFTSSHQRFILKFVNTIPLPLKYSSALIQASHSICR